MNIKKITQKQISKFRNIPLPLIKAVSRQHGGWEDLKEYSGDIVQYGGNCGFNGFIYYIDTVAFAERNKKHIEKMLKELSYDLGEEWLQTLTNFGGLKGYTLSEVAEGYFDKKSDQYIAVHDVLAKYALEEVARAIQDYVYES